MAENAQPIIVKKVKKVSHGGHHGGSWKVAYADFVTAMMAFFLLLWLLSSTNQETLTGIADYFSSPSAIDAAGGASTSMIELGSNIDRSKGDGEKQRESDSFEYYSEAFERMEMETLEALKEDIEKVIEQTPSIKEFKDQILIDITEEGLHIQIIDKNNRPMFDVGSSALKTYAKKILREISPILNEIPNKLSISVAYHVSANGFVSIRESLLYWPPQVCVSIKSIKLSLIFVSKLEKLYLANLSASNA